jgi:sulfite exporter TauE/SafE
MVLEALLLGLSSGTFCAVHCGPVAIPFFFSQEMDRKRNIHLFLLYLSGRLGGSIAVGLIVGAAGAYALNYVDPVLKDRITAVAYILIGLLMAASGLLQLAPALKPCRLIKKGYSSRVWCLLLGLLTGLNICPPFLAAASRVFGNGGGTLYGGLYFFLFFIGTSVYLLPLLGIHFLKKRMEDLRLVARIMMILLGIFFIFFYGLFKLLRGMA